MGLLVADWLVLTLLVLAAIPGAVAGAISGTVLLGILLYPLIGKIQGAPFAIGDRVWIMKGPHKGIRATVRDVWEQRGQVKVDLGPAARGALQDVVYAVEICRARDG